jgi:hypothetical protein
MARGRMVSKSLSTSKKRGALIAKHGAPCPTCGGSLAEFAQGLYMLLLAHADDYGRQDGDPFTVKLVVEPLSSRSEGDFIRALQALDEVQLVQWYPGSKGPALSVVAFDDHQWGLSKRTSSKFPEPPGISREPLAIPGSSREPLEIPPELNGTKGKGTKEVRTHASRRASPSNRRARPNVQQLAAMVLKEILPLRLGDSEMVEASKERAAKLHLAYDGGSITRAIASATTQLRKRRAHA